MRTKLTYYIPVYDKVNGEKKILRLLEGSTILEKFLELGLLERIPNSNTLKTKEKIYID